MEVQNYAQFCNSPPIPMCPRTFIWQRSDISSGGRHPPLSVRELARQIGIGEVRLHRHCPDLCSEIVRRYHNYRKLQGITRLQHMHEDLKDTIFHLYRQGYYPSLRKVREVLKEKKYAYKDFNDAWRSIMQDLQTDRDKQAPS